MAQGGGTPGWKLSEALNAMQGIQVLCRQKRENFFGKGNEDNITNENVTNQILQAGQSVLIL